MFELTEEQQAVQTSLRRFAQRELRWRARKLDSAPGGPTILTFALPRVTPDERLSFL